MLLPWLAMAVLMAASYSSVAAAEFAVFRDMDACRASDLCFYLME